MGKDIELSFLNLNGLAGTHHVCVCVMNVMSINNVLIKVVGYSL